MSDVDFSKLKQDGEMYSFYFSQEYHKITLKYSAVTDTKATACFVFISSKGERKRWRRFNEKIVKGKKPLLAHDDLEYLGDAPTNHVCTNGCVSMALQDKFGERLCLF